MSKNYWTTQCHIGHVTVNAVSAVRTSNLAKGKGKHYIFKAKKKREVIWNARELLQSILALLSSM